jgi:hypothetical protein
MSHIGRRLLAPLRVLGAVVMVLSLAQAAVAGQQQTAKRTAWGDPDLQGVYSFSTHTPLQRPLTLSGKDAYTAEELEALEHQLAEQLEEDIATNEHFSYNKLWFGKDYSLGKPTGRTSLIIDPENGRQPPYTEQMQKVREEAAAKLAARRIKGEGDVVHTLINTWEDHPVYTRCLARPMPRIFQEYNHGVQILQTPGYVAIHYESMNDVRIIPVDGRPHIDQKIRQWNGNSRGRWEGDTLVVDWTNFTDKQAFEGSYVWGPPQGNFHITERFARVDEKTIDYTVTIDDPATWTRPWTFVIPWRVEEEAYKGPEDLLEFACHEGNFRMMENTLTGTKALKQEHGLKD